MGRGSLLASVLALGACGTSESRDTPANVAPAATAPRDAGVALPPGAAIAFVDVSVVGMEAPRVDAHQTVVVQANVIVAIGPAATLALPAAVQKIDGRGKFLIPGLHDMHVHLDTTRSMLELFVTAGVTSVRNMSGSPRVLALRQRIARGDLMGPSVVTAGPFVDGARPRWEASDVVAKPADAEKVVAAQLAAGYDFIKVYNGLTVENYDAVAAAAKAHGAEIEGHVPFAVPLEHALAMHQRSVEHLSGYALALERSDSPVRGKKTDVSTIKRWLYVDPAQIPVLAAATVKAGVWTCPTLVTAFVYTDIYRGKVPAANGDLETVSPDWRAKWDPAHAPRLRKAIVKNAMEQAHAQLMSTEEALVKEISAAGGKLLAGTDTPNPYVVPGASLHAELALLVESGLSPYAALRAATIDAAEFVGDTKGGRIAKGAPADLVLLDADPLADIHATDDLAGVMLRGTWLPRERLRELHDGLVTEYRQPVWEQRVDLSDLAPKVKAAQYVVADNGSPVGAYAAVHVGGELIERQTFEDETLTARSGWAPDHHQRVLAIDEDHPEGQIHADHKAAGILVARLTPATAQSIVDNLTLEIDRKTQLAVSEPDPDDLSVLHKGTLTITRIFPDVDENQRVYKLRMTVDHGTWVGRVVVEGSGAVSSLKLTSTQRAITRTWRRR